MSTTTSTTVSPYRAFIDDAAIFPPGEASLPFAVEQHWRYRTTTLNEFVGPFVVGARTLEELAGLVRPDRFPQGLPVSVVVPPGGLAATLATVARLPRLVLAGLEVKLTDRGAEDEVRRAAALRGRLAPDVPLFIEVGRPTDDPSGDWYDVAAAVTRSGARLKLRTGGVTADAFPSDREMAIAITTAVSSRAAFKCTAGLHHAVRHRDPETGFEHHGFLNVLLATADALDGADEREVRTRLADRSGSALAAAVACGTPAQLSAARSTFVSYGSCSVDEPLADLEALGLLHLGHLETT